MFFAAARTVVLASIVTALLGPLASNQKLAAAPLVTGDLTIYYDFDNFTNTVLDGSGNGFDAKVRDATRSLLDDGRLLVTTGVISNDHVIPKRGAGAIRFTQSSLSGADPVFLDMDGAFINATAPSKVPSSAVTVAAWLNLQLLGGPNEQNGPGSILQMASPGPSFVMHYQIEGPGQIRLALRGQSQAQNIVSSGGAPFSAHPWPNQPDIDANGAAPLAWPTNEWHHTAVTYDKNANGGVGEFAMYFDGVKIRSGPPNGLTNANPTGPIDMGKWGLRAIGDYYDGLGIGAVMDSGLRRLHGQMDEFYLFTRALTTAEISTLALVPEPTSFSLLVVSFGLLAGTRRGPLGQSPRRGNSAVPR
jgi:hypothetical protein